MIAVTGLRKSYGAVDVLRVDDWQVPRGGRCAITGPSGSGKSTLLEILCALRGVSAGRAQVGDVEVTTLRGAAADRWRGRAVGVVTQAHHLLDILSVEENVRLAARMAGVTPARGRLEALLDTLGLLSMRHRSTRDLSQGERQRVALARALLCQPVLIVADEPTSSLDDDACEAMSDLLLRCCDDEGATLIVATHDRRIIPRFDRQLRLSRPSCVPLAAAA